ncbi:MAG: 16S rRNA (adenine(1518)-N(6)/adenine(1519)-N(6))-dimethyltransferase RsmA [Acidimicrobiia bacterium]|nr:16S rRNA (adenine(1518)-N(6)/adenine(1519)-N(6))-dimethyltransferase RsmA [Acidimicrobiia bacterium]
MSDVRPQGRNEIKQLLADHGLRPQRRLGQHFLADPNVVDRIVAEARIEPGDKVLEIGPGTGTLTRALAGAGASVVAYEVDRTMVSLLEEVVTGLDVELRFEDALVADWAGEFASGRWKMVANLPYNVGTPILLEAVRSAPAIKRFVVMVQREVGLRLVAEPGSKQYGLPSIVARFHTEPRLAFRVSPNVFMPPPEVESAVVVLDRIQPHPLTEEAGRLASVAFQQRRKMLRGTLADRVDHADFLAAEISPSARPEELSAADFLRLAEVIS